MGSPKVFISHRHEDVKIASVVTKHLKEWGIGNDSIYQSSDPRHGLTTGGKLHEELEQILEEINLLILVYTYSDADWSYCMWECGIAQGKSTAPSRIVVLQCTDDEPVVFREAVRVHATAGGVRSFAEDFHKNPGFIPSEGAEEHEKSFAKSTPDEVIASRSERFYDELIESIPSGTSSSQHLWDFIRLRIDDEAVNKIMEVTERDEIVALLRENVELREPRFLGIGNSVDTAVRQFGFAGYKPELKLSDLVDRWTVNDSSKKKEWINDIYDSMHKALTNSPSAAVSNTLKSVRDGVDWWFFPVITRMRTYRDHTVEFDMYLVRVPSSDKPQGKARSTKSPSRKVSNKKKLAEAT